MDRRQIIAEWLSDNGAEGDLGDLAERLLKRLHDGGFVVVQRGSESPVIAPPAGYVNGSPT